MNRKTVAIGFLGSTLDSGMGDKRWQRWRPTVAACMHDDLIINDYHLFYDRRHTTLAQRVARDMWQVSPETTVNCIEMNIRDPWDFQEVYGKLFDFSQSYDFKPDKEDYLINITTGTHVAQICMFLLCESRHFPAKLMQLSPKRGSIMPGSYQKIDLDLSKYCLLYTSPSPRDLYQSRMPSSA